MRDKKLRNILGITEEKSTFDKKKYLAIKNGYIKTHENRINELQRTLNSLMNYLKVHEVYQPNTFIIKKIKIKI